MELGRDGIEAKECHERVRLFVRCLRGLRAHLEVRTLVVEEVREREELVRETQEGYESIGKYYIRNGVGRRKRLQRVVIVRSINSYGTLEQGRSALLELRRQHNVVFKKYAYAAEVRCKGQSDILEMDHMRVHTQVEEALSFLSIKQHSEREHRAYLEDKRTRLSLEQTELSRRENIEQVEVLQVQLLRVVASFAIGRSVLEAYHRMGVDVMRRELAMVEEGARRQRGQEAVVEEYKKRITKIRVACEEHGRQLLQSEAETREGVVEEQHVARVKFEGSEGKGYCWARRNEEHILCILEDYDRRLERLVDIERRQRKTRHVCEYTERVVIKEKYERASEFLASFLKSKETTEAILAVIYKTQASSTQVLSMVEATKRGQATHEEGCGRRTIFRMFKQTALSSSIRDLVAHVRELREQQLELHVERQALQSV